MSVCMCFSHCLRRGPLTDALRCGVAGIGGLPKDEPRASHRGLGISFLGFRVYAFGVQSVTGKV